MGRYFRFEYVRCEGKIMRLTEAEDEYGYDGVLEHCSDVIAEISIYDETWKDASEKLRKILPEIIEYENKRYNISK